MTQFHHCLRLFALLTSGILACTSVQAAIISDNLIQARGGQQELSSASGGFTGFAQAFNTTSNSTITKVTVNLSMSATNSFLAIYNDASNKPGASVATIASGKHELVLNTNNREFSVSIPLAPMTKYWLVMGGSSGYWGYNSGNLGDGAGYLALNNTTKSTASTLVWPDASVVTSPYRLKIEAVPEPSAWLLAGGAAAALGLLRLRARGRVVRAS